MPSESHAKISSLPLPYTVFIFQSLSIIFFSVSMVNCCCPLALGGSLFVSSVIQGGMLEGSRVLGSEPLLTDNLPFISGDLTYLILSINT